MTAKIINFVKTPTANVYASDIAELISAGEGKAVVITVSAD